MLRGTKKTFFSKSDFSRPFKISTIKRPLQSAFFHVLSSFEALKDLCKAVFNLFFHLLKLPSKHG
jgi:hypothetical protein